MQGRWDWPLDIRFIIAPWEIMKSWDHLQIKTWVQSPLGSSLERGNDYQYLEKGQRPNLGLEPYASEIIRRTGNVDKVC